MERREVGLSNEPHPVIAGALVVEKLIDLLNEILNIEYFLFMYV